MGGSDENNPGLGVMRSTNLIGGVKGNVNGKVAMGEIRQNRRVLSDINLNIVRAQQLPKPDAINKRGTSQVNGMCEKKQCVAGHRPITRKFAAQLLKSQHQTLPVYTEPEQKTNSTKEFKANRDIIDLDTIDENCGFYDTVHAQPHVSTLQETEPMVAEEVELEMEDIEEELIVDIDSVDKHNPLAVVEYVDELHAHYKKLENSFCSKPNYMDHQADINDRMRSILIDWLIEVHYKFELMEETLYLTVNLIDRFLSVQPVGRKKLQLAGMTAMLVACKYEEVSVPVVDDMILISDKAYTRKEVLEMEKLMMNKLQFNLSFPTPYVFLRRFLKAAISDKKLELLASYIMELGLVEYEMLKFPPSLLAASAVFTAQCSIAGSKQWSKTSKWYSTYSEDHLMECAKLMVALHQKAPTSRLTGVYRKYSLSKYGYTAAHSEPALFLLDERL